MQETPNVEVREEGLGKSISDCHAVYGSFCKVIKELKAKVSHQELSHITQEWICHSIPPCHAQSLLGAA